MTVACRPVATSPSPVESTVDGAADASATVDPAADPAVELCAEGGSPNFDYGFAALKARLGDKMGTPLSCERPGPRGDSVQQTTTGYARYNQATNTPTFIRGSD